MHFSHKVLIIVPSDEKLLRGWCIFMLGDYVRKREYLSFYYTKNYGKMMIDLYCNNTKKLPTCKK